MNYHNSYINRSTSKSSSIIDLAKMNLNEVELGRFFTSNDCVTYMMDGIRVHKPPFGGFWAENAGGHRKMAEFVSPEGVVTDQFFGSCNDFDIWMKGKAARGERFFVIFYPNDPNEDEAYLATKVGVWFGPQSECHPWSEGKLEQGTDLRWSLVDNVELPAAK